MMRALLTGATAIGLWAAAAAPALPHPAPAGPARPGTALGAVQGTVRLDAADQAAPAMLSPYARRRYSPPAAAGTSGAVRGSAGAAAAAQRPTAVALVRRARILAIGEGHAGARGPGGPRLL